MNNHSYPSVLYLFHANTQTHAYENEILMRLSKCSSGCVTYKHTHTNRYIESIEFTSGQAFASAAITVTVACLHACVYAEEQESGREREKESSNNFGNMPTTINE